MRGSPVGSLEGDYRRWWKGEMLYEENDLRGGHGPYDDLFSLGWQLLPAPACRGPMRSPGGGIGNGAGARPADRGYHWGAGTGF